MPNVIIHTDVLSPYGWCARLVAAEKGVACDVKPVDVTSPAHLALHPFGKMPVLTHGDVVLFETLAIAHYLDRGFPGPALQPIEPLAQAHMLRWISMINSYMFPVMNGLIKERSAGSWRAEPSDMSVIEAFKAPLAMQFGLIEEAVRAHGFLAGPHLTLADCFLAPNLHYAAFTPEGAEALDRSPATADWMQRIRARPSFAATSPFLTA